MQEATLRPRQHGAASRSAAGRRRRQQPGCRGQAAPGQRAVPPRADHRLRRLPRRHHGLQGDGLPVRRVDGRPRRLRVPARHDQPAAVRRTRRRPRAPGDVTAGAPRRVATPTISTTPTIASTGTKRLRDVLRLPARRAPSTRPTVYRDLPGSGQSGRISYGSGRRAGKPSAVTRASPTAARPTAGIRRRGRRRAGRRPATAATPPVRCRCSGRAARRPSTTTTRAPADLVAPAGAAGRLATPSGL